MTWDSGEFDTATPAALERRYRRLWGVWNWDEARRSARALYLKLVDPRREQLGVQVLGDGKIRLNERLIECFGVTGVSGLQGMDETRAVIDASYLRARNTGTPGYRAARLAREELSRGGAILSESAWSTLANDAFILAGIHEGSDFVFVGEIENLNYGQGGDRNPSHTFEQNARRWTTRAYQLCLDGTYANMEAARLDMPRREWKRFFERYPQILWNDGDNCPRVFTRELLGLQRFGYTPQFNMNCMFFAPTGDVADDEKTFDNYLAHLASPNGGSFDNAPGNHQVGNGTRPHPYTAADKTRIVRHIHRYLFGDDLA